MANRVKTWVTNEILTSSDQNAEFDNIYSGSVDRSGGRWGSLDDVPLTFGSSQDVQMEWETTQGVDSFVIGLGTGNVFSVMEKADMTTNWAIGSQTNPTLYIHSADSGTTSDYLRLTHDQTNAVIAAGSGVLNIQSDVLISGTTPLLTVGDAGAEDAAILFDGNAQDFHIGLDDSADDLVIGSGSSLGTTPAISINSDQVVTFHQDPIFAGTTPTLTIGDAGAEDTAIVFDGNAQDFYIGLDDSADDLVIGLGSTLGTTPAISVDENQVVTFHQDPIFAGTTPTVTIGDAGAEDTALVFDGNAQDYYIGLDDSADDLVIGLGSTLGTTPAISIDENQVTTFHQDPIFAGTTPTITIGDAGAEDTMLAFDGNALDFHVALDDSADDLVIGTGTTAGSNTLVSINGDATGIELKVPTVTVGDGTAEDTQVLFDGNALDFHVGLDDSADDLVIGTGSTLGSNTLISINGDASEVQLKVPTVTVGDGTAEDTQVLFDGNALDFHVGLDDSADDLVIGTGSTLGSNTIISINGDASEVQLKVPTVTVGDATAEDTAVIFDGNAKDFYLGLDDSADDLIIGLGSTVGTNPAITVTGDGTEDVTLAGDLTVSGTGPHAVGGAGLNYAQTRTTGTFTSGGAGSHTAGLWVDGTIVGVSGDTTFNVGSYFSNSINTVAASETITDVVQVLVNEPQITKGSGSTVTNASSLKVIAAPTEGTNNYALWVAAGASLMDGALTVAGALKVTGTTPVLTIGDAGAEDTTLLFDGNATDFYIALDDSADDLLLGVGSTVGTTPFLSATTGPSVTITHENGGFVDIATSGSSGYLRMRGSTAIESSASALTLNGGGLATVSLLSAVTANSTFTLTDGGTVTQATNHGTGVTLNTNSGQITLASVDLAAGAEATFTVTNSVVAATDVVIVNVSDDQDAGTLLAFVDDVGAGTFDIVLSNVHASAASGNGGTVVNFAVIGGASS